MRNFMSNSETLTFLGFKSINLYNETIAVRLD